MTRSTASQCLYGIHWRNSWAWRQIAFILQEILRWHTDHNAGHNIAATFLQVLNNCHSSVKFTMETESNGALPSLSMQLLIRAPQIETKVNIKSTNTGILLHHQSPVDMRYKRRLLKTTFDRAYRLSSCWSHFSEVCDRLRVIFSRVKYPQQQ